MLGYVMCFMGRRRLLLQNIKVKLWCAFSIQPLLWCAVINGVARQPNIYIRVNKGEFGYAQINI